MATKYKTASASTEEQHVTVDTIPNWDDAAEWTCSGCGRKERFTLDRGPVNLSNAKDSGLRHADTCRL